MKKLLLSSVMLCIAITLFSCKGDQGDPGPAGANGVANISNTTFVVSSWTNPSSGYYEAQLSVSAITDYNNDLVECYIQAESNGSWIELPQTNLFYSGDNLTFSVVPSGVNVFYEYSSAPSGQVSFRVVVVPPSVASKMKNSGVNFSDYNSVNAYIQLNSK